MIRAETAASLSSRPDGARVTVVYPSPVEYRLAFFDLLAARPDVDLTVLFCDSDRTRSPEGLSLERRRFRSAQLALLWVKEVGGARTPHYFNPSVTRYITRSKTDIVVSGYGFPTALLSIALTKLRRIPWMLWSETHWGSVGWGKGVRAKVKRRVVRALVNSACAFLTPGRLAAEFLADLGAPREAIFRVANTCDIHLWRDQALRLRSERSRIADELGLSEERFIVTVGRLLPEKGVQHLLQAYALLRKDQPGWGLLIVGDGPYRHELERAVAGQGIEGVHFLGLRAAGALRRIFAISDIFCLPSLKETWGVVVNEALASGLPVVLSRQVGAAADLVEAAGTGFIVEEGNARALFEALRTLVEDPNGRERMARATWDAVEPYSYEGSVEQFVAACRYCLRRRRANSESGILGLRRPPKGGSSPL